MNNVDGLDSQGKNLKTHTKQQDVIAGGFHKPAGHGACTAPEESYYHIECCTTRATHYDHHDSWQPLEPPYISPQIQNVTTCLPTTEQIKACTERLGEAKGSSCFVVGVGTDYVIKYGRGVKPQEGENPVHLAKNSSIPFPHVFKIYLDAEGICYIVMQRVRGQTLEELVDELDDAQKLEISRELKTHLCTLHKMQAPRLDKIDSINSNGCDELLYGGENVKTLKTTSDVIEAILDRYDAYWDDFEDIKKTLSDLLTDTPLVFSHTDLQPKNIIINRNEAGKVIVWIVDWEDLGVYPYPWDLFKTMLAFKTAKASGYREAGYSLVMDVLAAGAEGERLRALTERICTYMQDAIW